MKLKEKLCNKTLAQNTLKFFKTEMNLNLHAEAYRQSIIYGSLCLYISFEKFQEQP